MPRILSFATPVPSFSDARAARLLEAAAALLRDAALELGPGASRAPIREGLSEARKLLGELADRIRGGAA